MLSAAGAGPVRAVRSGHDAHRPCDREPRI